MHIERISDTLVKLIYTTRDLQEVGIDFMSLIYHLEGSDILVQSAISLIEKELYITVDSPMTLKLGVNFEESLIVVVIDLDVDKELFDSVPHIVNCQCPKCSEDAKDEELNFTYEDYGNEVDDTLDSDKSTYLMYIFRDIEDVIKVAKSFYTLGYTDSKLFEYEKRYYFVLDDLMNDAEVLKDTEALLKEYGLRSKRTIEFITEYGNSICSENAIETLVTHFT